MSQQKPGFFENLFGNFFRETKKSLKDYVVSQVILSSVTLVLLLLGCHFFLNINHWILVPVCITIVDVLPFIGCSIAMLPWAAFEIFFKDQTELGLHIFLLYVGVMVVRQILEPFVRGKSLGLSPWEEVVSSVLGYVVFGMNGLGLIIGPVVYIAGKRVYKTFRPAASIEGKKDVDYIDITNDVVDVEDAEEK